MTPHPPPSDENAELRAQIAALAGENAALRTEVAFLRQLLDQVPAVVVVRDRDERLLFANQAAIQSAGHPLDQLLGRRPADLYPPEQAAVICAEHEALLRSGRPLSLDRPSLHDVLRDTSGVKLPLCDAQGQIYAVATIISDVTDLKLADARTARAALILASVRDSVIMTDLEGIVTYWNAGATRLFGWAEAEMLGRPLMSRYPAAMRPLVEQSFAAVRAGQPYTGEWQDLHRDGAVVWIDACTSLVYDPHGRPVGILGVAHDITVRKQVEAALQSHARRMEALRAIDQAILTAQPLHALTSLALTQLSSLLACDDMHVSVFQLAEGAAATIAAFFREGARTLLDRPYPLPPPEALALLQEGRPVHIADLQQFAEADPRYRALLGDGRRALLGVPMVADERVVGVLNLGRRTPGLFSPEEIRIAQDLAAILAVGIAQDQLREAEQQSRQIAQTISAANLALTHHLDLAAVLETLLDYLMILVPYTSAVVVLLEGESGLRSYAMRGYDPEIAAATMRLSFDISTLPITARVITQKRSLRLDDIQRDPEWVACPGTGCCRSWLGVPLIAGDQVIGLYSLDKAEPGFFTSEHLRLAELLAPQAVIAIENAQLFAELQRNRAELQHVSRQLVLVQEAERAHLARELHDEIGQLLTGLHFTLESELRTRPLAGGWQIREALAVSNSMIQRVREISLGLSPPMLDELGLEATLRWYTGRFADQTGIAVDFRHSDLDRPIEPSLALSVYRIIQAALTNVARHAGVVETTVQVWAAADLLVLQVIDAGCGFDLAELDLTRSSGLAGMRERARLMGGQLVISTAVGHGTRITAEIPLV